MPQRHSRYVYRGDIERRRAKLRKIALLLVAVVAGTVAWKGRTPAAANAEEAIPAATPFAFGIGTGSLKSELESVRGELDLTRAQRAAQDMINQSGKALGRAVIDEDRAILENVQRGVELSEKPGVIGRDEIRIAAFMRAYTHLMGGGSLGGIPPIDDHVAAGDPARSIAE